MTLRRAGNLAAAPHTDIAKLCEVLGVSEGGGASAGRLGGRYREFTLIYDSEGFENGGF